MKKNNEQHLLFFLMAFLYSTAFTNLLELPIVKNRVQLPELLFLPIFFFGIKYLTPVLNFSFFKKYHYIFPFLYVISNLISSFSSGVLTSVLESFGKIYLFLVYVIAIEFFSQYKKTDLKQLIYTHFFNFGLIISGTILIGFCLWAVDIATPIGDTELYPYLGKEYRAEGFTRSATMLATLLLMTVSIVFYHFLEKKEKKDIFLVVLMFFVAVLTFSKSILLISLNIALLVCWFYLKKYLKYLNAIFIVGAFFILNIATHYLPIAKNFAELTKFKAQYISDKIAFSIADFDIYETCYAATKRESFTVFSRNPILGVGTGNFDTQLEILQKQGFYSPTLPIYNPHCTYIGALAENGFIGFSFLIAFLWVLYKMAKHNIFEKSFDYALYLILVSLLLESWVTDTMNFRQLWFFFALLVAYHLSTNQGIAQKPLEV